VARSLPARKSRYGSWLALITVLLALGSTGAARAAEPAKGPAVWLYRFPDQNTAAVVPALQQHGVRRVFLSVRSEWLERYAEKLRGFLRAAHRAGIEVDAMTLQDPSYVRAEKHPAAMGEIDRILAFCRAEPAAAFDGVHLDAEPHVLFRGGENRTADDWAFNEGLMKQYVELLAKASQKVRESGVTAASGRPLQLSAAVAWWYNERARDGRLPSGAAVLLGRHLDFVVPMVYDGIGGSSADVIRRVSDELTAVPTMIGLARKEFKRDEDLQQAIRALDEKYRDNPRYRGVSIFEYDRWLREPAKSAPDPP
jgi:hypothetical protein